MVKHILGREEALIDDMCEQEVTSFRLCRLSACPGHRPSLPLPPDALAFLSGFFTSFSSTPTTTPHVHAQAHLPPSISLACHIAASVARKPTRTRKVDVEAKKAQRKLSMAGTSVGSGSVSGASTSFGRSSVPGSSAASAYGRSAAALSRAGSMGGKSLKSVATAVKSVASRRF